MPVFVEQPSKQLGAAPEQARDEAALRSAFLERQAVAQTLHDTLCQSMSGLQLLTRLAERKAARLCPELAGDLGELRELIGQASEELHQLVHTLRTPQVDAGAEVSKLPSL